MEAPGVTVRACAFASNQSDGITHGWQRVAPGERLAVIVDEVESAIEQVHTLRAAMSRNADCQTPIAGTPAVGTDRTAAAPAAG
jgi:hypothetical protein